MAKEGNSSASEFSLVQVKAKTSLTSTLKNSTKVFIIVTNVTVAAIHNNVMCDSSDTYQVTKRFYLPFFGKCRQQRAFLVKLDIPVTTACIKD